jgi:hypothetical protein
MLWHSTYEENLKRKMVRRELGELTGEAYESCPLGNLHHIEKLAIKAGVDPKNVFFYRRREEVRENCYEERIHFYYESLETDGEYEKRISELEKKDLQEFCKNLIAYRGFIQQKAQVRMLLDKHVKKSPGLFPDHYKAAIDAFYSEETIQEREQKAYERGKKAGAQEAKEKFEAKLKALTK